MTNKTPRNASILSGLPNRTFDAVQVKSWYSYSVARATINEILMRCTIHGTKCRSLRILLLACLAASFTLTLQMLNVDWTQ